ncbi:MAG: FAD-binding oxidoreductase [Thermoplasmatota archaeon]
MKQRADVVIIGGGVNGVAIAYRLAQAGLDVTVIEKKYLSSGATGKCGAGIRQQWSTAENTELSIESVHMFEHLSDELGMDIEFRQGGYLIINHSKKELLQSEENVAMQRSLGLDVRVLDASEIHDIVPVLDIRGMRAVGATFCPSDGHANPFLTTFAFANAARRHGASIYTHTTVTGITTKQNRVVSVETSKGSIRTPWVVVAAGEYSKDIAAMVGIDIPNRPYRKEVLATERLQPLFEAMVISFTDGIYFSQQKEGQIVGGIPIPDEHSGFVSMPSFSFLQHMSQTLTRYVPLLAHVNMLRHWTGFYDVTPDARPILGEDKTVKGFVHCHGFSGHGFMISPMVSKLLSDYISKGTASSVLDRLTLDRFEGADLTKEHSVVG